MIHRKEVQHKARTGLESKGEEIRGLQTFAHDVDIVIKVEDGFAYAQGRFDPPSQMNIHTIVPEPLSKFS
ncbi:hypothetical protein DBR32_14720 [Taibaiella sp. KBW10]|nr:hypothetical protein DBR32_14720 [Taibaiella sp. KBW10]